MQDLLSQVVKFDSATRFYELSIGSGAQSDASSSLIVEAFVAQEALHSVSVLEIIALSTDAHISLKTLIGVHAHLQISLADGSRTTITGLISEAAMLGSDGGLGRYRLHVVPWLWLLSQARNSRVWQDKTIIDIIDSVFRDYDTYAAWVWSSDATALLARITPRSYCCQYRETDLAFIQRLLAEEGISFRIEESADAPAGHRLVLFADTTQDTACPEDPTSKHAPGTPGLRYHAGRAVEEQDSILTFTAARVLQSASVTLQSYDYKAKKAVAASVPTNHLFGGKNAPRLESYDTPGIYAYTDSQHAQHYGQLQMQAHEARNKLWHGTATVRTLRAGTRFTLTQGPLATAEPPSYIVLAVTGIGINNMPKPVVEGLAELFGPIPALLESCIAKLAKSDLTAHRHSDLSSVVTKATQLGYASTFDAIRADIVWRPVLVDGTGLRQHPAPTAHGSQCAIVVGAKGQTTANGTDEIHCDRLGRVRIKFHWQGQHDDANATCWVRVAQRAAQAGMGMQFLPRIGQEVLVQFIEGDIDRPLIIGALYNGQGEGGITPTPAGKVGHPSQRSVFSAATDHAPSAQGNTVSGNSPVWHGAGGGGASSSSGANTSSDGHCNTAALWGIRSKEFGGNGYNQLLFDDTDAQGRIQLKSTAAGTELNLGHLRHLADNYRGSFRGTGAELRTDAYGTLRAAKGLLITSYAIDHNAAQRTPAGDNSAGMALLKQASQLTKTFDQAATTHRTSGLASQSGPNKAGTSVINEAASPAPAFATAAAGMVDSATLAQASTDASQHNTQTDAGKLPYSSDALITISAKAGLATVAGQSLQLANGETTTIISGQDSQFITGNQMRAHSGQTIGILAGAVQSGPNQTGLQLIAAQGKVDLQAQSDNLAIQARDTVSVISSDAHIDLAAAKRISLTTAGGANITIEGGNITVQCPGKLTIHASEKKFEGPVRGSYPLPQMPRTICVECLKKAMRSGSPLAALS